MLATKIKLAVAASLTAGVSAALVGFVIAAAPSRTPDAGSGATAIARTSDAPNVQAGSPRLAAKLSASGTVVDSSGKPIMGARVILREWSEFRIQGMPQQETEKLLRGERAQRHFAGDQDGRSRPIPVPGCPRASVPDISPRREKASFPWDIVALAPGHGLAWVQLTPQHQRAAITLKLGPEGILRGRVVEPGGKPVAGAKVNALRHWPDRRVRRLR